MNMLQKYSIRRIIFIKNFSPFTYVYVDKYANRRDPEAITESILWILH